MRQFSRISLFLLLVPCAVFAAELAGIWMGEAPGRNGQKQDIAFQFKVVNGVLSGTMFGDEFDLPVEDLKVEGDRISFSVTNTNYYNRNRQTMIFMGTLSSKEIQLTRERKATAAEPLNEKPGPKQTITLKRVT